MWCVQAHTIFTAHVTLLMYNHTHVHVCNHTCTYTHAQGYFTLAWAYFIGQGMDLSLVVNTYLDQGLYLRKWVVDLIGTDNRIRVPPICNMRTLKGSALVSVDSELWILSAPKIPPAKGKTKAK
jgi:hypothetical protein